MELADLMVLLGALVGGFFAGLTGFGTGLSAMPFWLSAVSPVVAAQLAAGCGALGQAQTIGTIWPSVRWRYVGHFVVAGLIGVPFGTVLLTLIPERTFKLGVGLFLIAFCTYMTLARGRTMLRKRRPLADITVGFSGGIMSGLAGLSGPLPTAWATLHDWPRDEKRALFQTFNLIILIAMLISSAIAGQMSWAFGKAMLIAVPGTLIGTRLGSTLYRRLDVRGFDRIVLAVLLASGLALVWSNY